MEIFHLSQWKIGFIVVFFIGGLGGLMIIIITHSQCAVQFIP